MSRWRQRFLALTALCLGACGEEETYYPSSLVPGEPMPAYSAVSLEGNSVQISSFEGEVVLLNFWATWCSPCVAELPTLQDLEDEYQDRGLRVITVSLDRGSRPEVQRFLSERGHHWLNLFDSLERQNAVFGWGYSVPKSVLVNRDGTVAVWWLGGLDPDLPRNRTLIDAAVRGKAVLELPSSER